MLAARSFKQVTSHPQADELNIPERWLSVKYHGLPSSGVLMPQQDVLFYVSIKGVILQDDRVLMLRKVSGEWDLPGGRLGEEESPRQCLIREVREETGLTVRPGRFLNRWIRRRPGKTDVFLVSHLCQLIGPGTQLSLTHEHCEADWFSLPALEILALSKGIRKSVRRAYQIR